MPKLQTRYWFSACALALALACGARATPALADSGVTRAIDPAKSRAQFSIAHIFVEWVTGTIPITGGTVELAAGSAIPLAVSATLDPAKIETGDRDRDAALAGPEYFDVANFPQWTFASTRIVATGPSAFAMDGSLTIHGVAQPEHLDVTVAGTAVAPVYHATGHIDRHAFGMKGARLDPVIGNTADVTLDIGVLPAR
jgi:polyisoprenoid-binding protein YceI